jgi:hypothetical protein
MPPHPTGVQASEACTVAQCHDGFVVHVEDAGNLGHSVWQTLPTTIMLCGQHSYTVCVSALVQRTPIGQSWLPTAASDSDSGPIHAASKQYVWTASMVGDPQR